MTSIDQLGGEVAELKRQMRDLMAQSPLESSSVSNGRVRFRGGLLRVDSGGRVEIVGVLDVEGATTFSGDTDIVGDLDITGPTQIDGATTINGNFWVNGYTRINGGTEINGATSITGDVTLDSDLTLGSGRIMAGAVTITPSGGGQVQVGNIAINGGSGGTISAASTIFLEGSGAVSVRVQGQLSVSSLLSLGKITAGELDVIGSKNFRMPHPTKPGHWLRHGSTESPVSGTEYTGRAKLGANGEAVVKLPEYFEALNKPEGRTVQVTPVGAPFPVGADVVANGQVKVYGTPGREVFWLVKAERVGGDFLLEEEIPDEEEDSV